MFVILKKNMAIKIVNRSCSPMTLPKLQNHYKGRPQILIPNSYRICAYYMAVKKTHRLTGIQ